MRNMRETLSLVLAALVLVFLCTLVAWGITWALDSASVHVASLLGAR